MTKVKITSDGTGPGTVTVIHINGERIDNIGEVTWHLKPTGLAEVRIKLVNVELDVDGQVAMKFEGSPVKLPTAVDVLKAIAPHAFERCAQLAGTNNMDMVVEAMVDSLRNMVFRLDGLDK